MSQLQVTGEAKIRDIQGPVVANSGVVTALDGAASQYVRGDGTLADFPTSTGGGSSVSYYLNSSVSQGTIGGVAYRELNKEPIIGAGTDITISANGYVASYITDANDPDLLSVPGGNFNCEFYFSVDSDAHNPSFYAELYKYDGTTFTLLGSSQAAPEYLSNGTTISPYYFAIPVATAALALTDRLAIRIYVNVDTRTVTLHTENSHLCQVVTTFSKGMVSLNNLTDQSQFITTGTSGTDFNIVSTGDTHTFNIPVASATNTGKLSSSDWSIFNNKQNALTNPVTGTGTTNTLPKFTGTSAIGNSNITDTGSLITLGSNSYLNGSVGIGSTPSTNIGLLVGKNITGGVTSYGTYSNGTIQSDVTTNATFNATFIGTAAASFTVNNAYGYYVAGTTIGAGSAISTQQAYYAHSNFTGATNNYGFRGAIPSGTNRWNLYMDGTANNYLAGKLLVGSTTDAGEQFQITGTSRFIGNITISGSSSTANADIRQIGFVNTANSANVKAAIVAVNGADSDDTSLSFRTSSNSSNISERLRIAGNGATSISGQLTANSFVPTSSTIPTNGMYLSGTNTLGFATNGTLDMVLDANGALGIGTTSLTGYSLRLAKSVTGAANYYGIESAGTIQSDVTGSMQYFQSVAATQATTFTLSALRHYFAFQSTFGAGSTVTTQIGYFAHESLIGATNNYGFFGNIPAAANRWNLYMNGTANNYMAGQTGIGTTTLGSYIFNVGGSVATLVNFNSTNASGFYTTYSTSGTERAYIGLGANTISGLGIADFGIVGSSNVVIASGSGGTETMRIDSSKRIGIGTGASINASAKVQIDSTTQGFLPPRMTAAQRTAIATPAEGLIVVQTDGTQGLYLYIGAAWHAITML